MELGRKCYPCHSTNITQEILKMKQMFEKVFKEEGKKTREENEILKPDFPGKKPVLCSIIQQLYQNLDGSLLQVYTCPRGTVRVVGSPGRRSSVCRWPMASLKFPSSSLTVTNRNRSSDSGKPARQTSEYS